MSSDRNSEQDPRPGGGDDPATSRHRRVLGALTLLLLASWLLMLAPLPYSLLAGVTGLGALGLMVPVIMHLVRRRRYGAAVMAGLLGTMATITIVAVTLLSVLFYGPRAENERCRATAITERARAQCDQDISGSAESWFSGLVGD